jgi:hypothetical protein
MKVSMRLDTWSGTGDSWRGRKVEEVMEAVVWGDAGPAVGFDQRGR